MLEDQAVVEGTDHVALVDIPVIEPDRDTGRRLPDNPGSPLGGTLPARAPGVAADANSVEVESAIAPREPGVTGQRTGSLSLLSPPVIELDCAVCKSGSDGARNPVLHDPRSKK